MTVILVERILTDSIVLKQPDVILVERELDPAIILQQKTVTLMERILQDAVQLSGADFEMCLANFGFTNLVPSLFTIGLSTFVKFSWETGYDVIEKEILYRTAGETWITLGPIATTGASFSMNSALPVGRGSYEWYAKNRNVCGNQGVSTMQTFDIIDGTPPDDYEIIIT